MAPPESLTDPPALSIACGWPPFCLPCSEFGIWRLEGAAVVLTDAGGDLSDFGGVIWSLQVGGALAIRGLGHGRLWSVRCLGCNYVRTRDENLRSPLTGKKLPCGQGQHLAAVLSNNGLVRLRSYGVFSFRSRCCS